MCWSKSTAGLPGGKTNAFLIFAAISAAMAGEDSALMTNWSSDFHDLDPAGDRLALRAQAAELLIEAADPAEAGRALFDLIAAELKLNTMILYVPGDSGGLELIAHRGLSD